GKVLYVWLDAPIGYISATKQWALDNGKDWELYWKNEETKLVHFIGKDNIVFHCITFPSLLKANGEYILPDDVPANEFMNLQGDKISTSRNWAVWVHEYVDEFPDKVDELRYTLIANMPETKDAEFTWEDYQARVNNELVATLGNLENRVVVLINKYWEGVLPEVDASILTEEDKELLHNIMLAKANIGNAIEEYKFREALNALMDLARKGNKYLGDNEPWKLIKQDEAAAKRILYISAQVVASFATLAQPFLPFTAEKIKVKMNLSDRNWLEDTDWISGGSQIEKGALLFQKIEDSLVEGQVKRLEANKSIVQKPIEKYTPMKPEITFDDFTKLDIRTGMIVAAQKIPKADKLLNLTVDLGFEMRTIVSGIAEHFKEEEVIGKKVAVVINLAPRKLRGVESQGMILMAEDMDGKLGFVANSEMASGMVIR
ncbi:MAG: methionine--tRNA ligase subunit beta, partial [Bacteroidetes bacterium]|nr:methionine--tRNA ligase subunit beta [Bacteroidota bacterium]